MVSVIPKCMHAQKNVKYLARGKRSFVFLTRIKNKLIIIKKSKPDTPNKTQHEASLLKILNKYKIGPKLIKHTSSELYIEYIQGKTIREFLEAEKNKQKIKTIINKILKQLRTLDNLKINKEEMVNPYKHIIITKANKVVLIDFERSRFTEKPSNITQFFQYLSANKLVTFNEELKQLLRDYKNNPSETNYKKLLKFVK